MANNLRDLLQPIIAEAVEKAVSGYRKMLLGDDAPSPKAKPGPKPANKAAPSPTAAGPAAKPARKKSKKVVRRDSKDIQKTVKEVLAFIQGHSGLRSEAIAAQMGGNKADISDALWRLRSKKKVQTSGLRREMTYRVGASATAKAAVTKAAPAAPKAAKKAKATEKKAAKKAAPKKPPTKAPEASKEAEKA